ncbi:MAG: excinuclease ABC subunit UvrC [Cyclobacteriaceae bacterium]|jgi:excinuclease ABC subunit C|nr:excinuclease ABC subunit UvrC [Cyclobacteriaceae bacterium]
MFSDELKRYALNLPDEPGVYRFYNDDDQLIYVGKAKSLKKRVNSYFNKTAGHNRKTLRLISEIKRIEYTLANTEFDALLLENNLIKQNQPRYNILLKDDKTFPYLCLVNERFPRIISTRKFIPKQGEYFGPYASVVAMKNVLDLIRKLYTIRTCTFALTKANIEQKKFKVCLEFHIGNCKGPCENLQTEEEYNKDIDQCRQILKGNLSVIENYFSARMDEASATLQFERAHFYKEKLLALERFQSKSLVVNRSLTDIDVITIASNEEYAYINYMVIKEGAIIFSKTIEVRKNLNEPDDEIVTLAYLSFREQRESTNSQVYSNVEIAPLPENISCTIPKIGDKKKLIALSLKNAMEMQKERELVRAEKKSKKTEVISILKNDLHLSVDPVVIECFDNSNIQGTTPVASMVRFVNGKPDKKNYRHFNIKTVTGPNDFESMKEIVFRRYRRLLDENYPLPDLIVVDGGKGQLSSACEALQELDLYKKIQIIGIAKKLEEIYYPEDSIPLHISKKSPGLLLLQQIRDEAHRFAITFHRQKRTKNQIHSELDQLKGVGEKTISKLLSHFKSIKKIKEASLEELEQIIGASKARQVRELQQKTP